MVGEEGEEVRRCGYDIQRVSDSGKSLMKE
jgi:hypothetical protein